MYVGVVDDDYVLVQHLTKLYILHVGIVSEEFAYQQVACDFCTSLSLPHTMHHYE